MDEILAARGITVRHETTRQWALKVRPEHRQSEPPQAAPCWRDMAPRRGCREDRRKKHWLWRAVDQDGDVIMTVRVSRRKSWFLGVVLALAPIAAFGEDIDGQINQLLEKIRQQDTTSGNLTELIKLVDEALPLIMKAPPESLDRIRELSALIERKSALSGVGQAEFRRWASGRHGRSGGGRFRRAGAARDGLIRAHANRRAGGAPSGGGHVVSGGHCRRIGWPARLPNTAGPGAGDRRAAILRFAGPAVSSQ